MWDAMTLHDVHKFKQEEAKWRIQKMEKQSQLRKFYDNQVWERKQAEVWASQKAQDDHKTVMFSVKKVQDELDHW